MVHKRVLNCLWELTYTCNARCGICNYWKNPSDPKTELTLRQIEEGLRKVHAYGCRFINFTGGEPTLRPDLDQIVNAASRLGIWTSIVSNGSLLTRRRIQQLKDAGLDNLVLSLDSLDPAIHDAQRGISGLHAKVLERLNWISEDFLTGHRTGGIMCVLGRHNLHQSADFVELAEKLGVYLVFQPYHQNKTGDPDPISSMEKETLERLQTMKGRSTALLSSRAYLNGLQSFSQGKALPRCQAGVKYFSVDPFGYLHPCVDSPRVGHILSDEVSIVRSDEALKAVDSCTGCWYCFRGEADSTLSFRGYAEKLQLAASIYIQNLRNHSGKSSYSRNARQE
jgi:MoaA/NifB/PqqE/SkfB family radical SAM enzyme